VGWEPTAAAVDAGVGAAVEVDRWSRGGTTSDHDNADKLWKCPSGVERHELL
jgi:hypothetical protein